MTFDSIQTEFLTQVLAHVSTLNAGGGSRNFAPLVRVVDDNAGGRSISCLPQQRRRNRYPRSASMPMVSTIESNLPNPPHSRWGERSVDDISSVCRWGESSFDDISADMPKPPRRHSNDGFSIEAPKQPRRRRSALKSPPKKRVAKKIFAKAA